MATQIINATPHQIVEATTSTTFQTSGIVARVSVANTEMYILDGISVCKSVYGEVYDLPAPVEGTFYIVSALVRSAMPERKDLLSPGELVRDEAGQPVGCKGFVTN